MFSSRTIGNLKIHRPFLSLQLLAVERNQQKEKMFSRNQENIVSQHFKCCKCFPGFQKCKWPTFSPANWVWLREMVYFWRFSLKKTRLSISLMGLGPWGLTSGPCYDNEIYLYSKQTSENCICGLNLLIGTSVLCLLVSLVPLCTTRVIVGLAELVTVW